MTRQIRVRSVRRREVDEDRLAVAFLLLAKILHEQAKAKPAESASPPGPPVADDERGRAA